MGPMLLTKSSRLQAGQTRRTKVPSKIGGVRSKDEGVRGERGEGGAGKIPGRI